MHCNRLGQFSSQFYQSWILPISTSAVKCKELIVGIFNHIKQWAHTAAKSLERHLWKSWNTKSLSSQLILSADKTLLSFGENKNMPMDIFVSRILPALSIQDLHCICRTHKASFNVLKDSRVLNHLFSSAEVDKSELSYSVGPSLDQVTQLKWGDFNQWRGFGLKQLIIDWRQNRKFLKLIEKCPNLASLHLSRNMIKEADVHAWAQRCPHLTSLDLSACEITSAGMRAVAQRFPNLISLCVAGNEPTDTDIQFLAQRCTKLTKFSLEKGNCWTFKITDAAIDALAQNCPNLAELALTFCDDITDAGVGVIAQRFPKLISLNLVGQGIKNASIRSLTQSPLNLTSLKLSSPKISSLGLQELARGHFNLKNLELPGMMIQDTDLLALTQKYSKLTSLNLEWSLLITDAGIQKWASNCSNLENINLKLCPQVTDTGIKTLIQNCPRLKSLGLKGCRITESLILFLIQNYPELKLF